MGGQIAKAQVPSIWSRATIRLCRDVIVAEPRITTTWKAWKFQTLMGKSTNMHDTGSPLRVPRHRWGQAGRVHTRNVPSRSVSPSLTGKYLIIIANDSRVQIIGGNDA